MKTPKEWIEELNRPEYVTLPCATVHKSDIAAIQQDAQSSAWECARLRKAIEETIADNLHLSDGEDCTFIKLKRALNSEREETPKEAAQSKWLPIENAPHGGRLILITNGRCVMTGYYGGSNSGWRTNDTSSLWPIPTHWQPLPEPPKKCEPLASQVSSDGVLGLEIRSK